MTTHVMLDLETLSTRKNACIVQIAAIAFDPRDGSVSADPSKRPLFNRFVIDTEGFIDPKTVAWWLQQKAAPALGKKIETCGRPLDTVLREFYGWYEDLGKDVEAVWSHGATFDIAIVEQRCSELGLPMPWHYRHPRDTRTLYALAPGGMPAVPGNPELTHDALYDCEVQIKQVVGALAALRQRDAEVERWKEEYRVTEAARASFEEAFNVSDAHAVKLERALGQGPRGPRGATGPA